MPNQQRAPAARTGHRRLLPQARLKLSRTSSCARRGPRTHSAASRSPPCPDLVPIFLRVADDDAEARSYDDASGAGPTPLVTSLRNQRGVGTRLPRLPGLKEATAPAPHGRPRPRAGPRPPDL
eukprot:tig00020805_g14004.t1